MKIGIVIQGPILSFGKIRRTMGWRDISKENTINFNCIATISSNFKKYLPNFNIVCSTWNDEDALLKKELLLKIGSENLIFNEDNTRPFVLSNNSILPRNNKYRQIYSTLQGIKFLKSKGCGKFIKVRTDQEINVDLIANQLTSTNKFLVPKKKVMNDLPYLEDVYFAGDIDIFIKIFDNYLSSKEKHLNVHYDLFFSIASYLLDKKFYFSKYYHPDNHILKFIYKKDFELMWEKHLDFLEEEVFNTQVYRGSITHDRQNK